MNGFFMVHHMLLDCIKTLIWRIRMRIQDEQMNAEKKTDYSSQLSQNMTL